MTNSLLVWSSQLERLGKLLVEDRRLPDRECEDYGYHRRLIQNNMDAARYLSPQLRNRVEKFLSIPVKFLKLKSLKFNYRII